ncbi:HAMP domain-containing protein, partial [Rhodovulum euryhalinum]
MLKTLLEMPISRRLPLSIAAIVLSVTTFMGFVLYDRAYDMQRGTVVHSLEMLARDQALRVEQWFDDARATLAAEAASPFTASTIRNFRLAIAVDGGGMTAPRQAYRTGNATPEDPQQGLADAGDGTAYSAEHKRVHPRFARAASDLGYRDIFMFDPAGELIYSVAKEQDFGENFVSGAHAESGLGQAFQAALGAPQGTVVTVDFAPYGPSGGDAASFMATPVFDALGLRVGVLAIQLSTAHISSLVTTASALGEYGDMFVVGGDGRARTLSRFEDRFGVFDALPRVPVIADLVAGKTGMYYGVTGVSGKDSIAFSVPLDLDWADWTLVAELDKTEYLAGLVAFRNNVLVFVALGLAAALTVSAFGSRTITRPLAGLVRSMEEVAGGRFDADIPVARRGDELGTLGRALADFRDRLAETETLGAARDEDRRNQDRVVGMLSEALQRLSSGDLTESLDAPFPADYEQLRHDFNATVSTLNEMLASIAENATEIHARAEEIGGASDDLSHRTENQAATLEETAA